MEQIHPLVRSFQNPRIVPGQPPQVLTVHAEIASRLDEVAEMPRQHNRRSLVAKMRESRRTLRHVRHQRVVLTLGRAMGSGGISSACTSRKRRLLRLRPSILNVAVGVLRAGSLRAMLLQTVRKLALSGFLCGIGHVRIAHDSPRRIGTRPASVAAGGGGRLCRLGQSGAVHRRLR